MERDEEDQAAAFPTNNQRQETTNRTMADARSRQEALQALQQVYIENEKLFNQSNSFLERMYQQGDISLARRNVLWCLFQKGPQTVPQLARIKAVSRQYMQRLVNRLMEEAYVEPLAESKQKRSPLLQLTVAGRAYMTEMLQREAKIVMAMEIAISVETLRMVAEGLQTIRAWQKGELDRLLQEYLDEPDHDNETTQHE